MSTQQVPGMIGRKRGRRAAGGGQPGLVTRRLGAAAASKDLDEFVISRMSIARTPGLAACMVRDGGVVWAKGYGLANIENGSLATTDTIFAVGSISKTVTATALMQLFEAGRLNLDGDVSDYLPFAVRNPKHPRIPITPVMLLSHASGIRDYDPTLGRLFMDGDSTIGLREFLEAYLHPGNELYNADRNFSDRPPGIASDYSNVGYALAGYLVETIGGMPFPEFCQRRIFDPLGMDETSWFIDRLDRARVAMPYTHVSGVFAPLGHCGSPVYPSGRLRTSVRQLGTFLTALIGGGVSGNVRILSNSTVARMRALRHPQPSDAYGLGLICEEADGRVFIGHDSWDFGVCGQMWFEEDTGTGAILLSNGGGFSPSEQQALLEMFDRLLAQPG